MTDKSLKDKTIDLKGKAYVLVSDRVLYFNENYPNGSIQTILISEPSADIIVIQAVVTPDGENPTRVFCDYAQEVMGSSFINKTSAMENASTSAVGRALAYMGIGVIDSIASIDEVQKATNRSAGTSKKATDKQVEWMLGVAEKKCGKEDVYDWVTKLLTVKPEDVPVFKVKDAVDLINKQPYPKGSELNVNIDDIGLSEEDVIKLQDGTLLNDIPY